MNDLIGDIEGDLATLLAELGQLEQNRQEKRTHIHVHEHKKAMDEAIKTRDAQLIAAIDRAVDAMTGSILRAMATPKQIVRDPETNRVLGSRPASPTQVTPEVDPAQLASASPPVRELYKSLLRLGQTVGSAIDKPKRIVRDAAGRPQQIE